MNELFRNSFDLEQHILSTWNVLDDIRTLYKNVLEDDHLSKDDIANVLLGLATLYNMKFDASFHTFETVHGGLCDLNNLLDSTTAVNRERATKIEELIAENAALIEKSKAKKPANKLSYRGNK